MGGGIMTPPVNQRRQDCSSSALTSISTPRFRSISNSATELGNPVKLADYFGHGRPVILNLGYYQCPISVASSYKGWWAR